MQARQQFHVRLLRASIYEIALLSDLPTSKLSSIPGAVTFVIIISGYI
eukprot:SAG31_NODE_147_length_22539_cov_37.073663_3_plen_48_part_00